MQNRGHPFQPSQIIPSAAALMAALGLVSASCAAPSVQYFLPSPSGHRALNTVADTVPIRRLLPPDSISVEGVYLAVYLRRAARRAEAGDAVRVLDAALASVPGGDRMELPRDYAPDRSLVAGIAAQGTRRNMDLARADALIVTGVRLDSVDVTEPGSDPETPAAGVGVRWLVLVWTAETSFDPALGVRNPTQSPQGDTR